MDRRERAEAWLAGVMDDADREAYERALMADPEARRELLAAARRDLALGRAVAALDERPTARKRRVYVPRGQSLLPWAVAAALAVALVGLIALQKRPPAPPVVVERRETPAPEVVEDPLREEEIRREEERRRRLAELQEIEREKQRSIEENNVERVQEQEKAEERVIQELKKIDAERAPEPPRPPAPVEPTRVAALAQLRDVKGEVLKNGAKAAEGADLLAGETVEGRARVAYADGSSVVLDGASLQIAANAATLSKGAATFQVGKAFVVTTPHAEARVLGTRFTVRVATSVTRVEVEEGLVRLTDRKTKRYTTVARGQIAEAGQGAPSARLAGLTATYFDRMDFKGPAIQRVDRAIDLLHPDNPQDLPPIGRDRTFSVRWEGLFLAEEEGDYAFVLSLDGAVRLSLDGQQLYSDDLRTPQPIHTARIVRRLAAGWHDLAVEYADDTGVARVSLRYVPPAGTDDPAGLSIPARLLAVKRR